MNDILIALHDSFYAPPNQVELEQEVNQCHQQLIERLEKPERKLVLRIIDAQNAMADTISMDSFVHGFKLGWKLSEELWRLEDRHSHRCRDERDTA